MVPSDSGAPIYRKMLRNNLVGNFDKDVLDSMQETSMPAGQLSIANLVRLQELLNARSAAPTP